MPEPEIQRAREVKTERAEPCSGCAFLTEEEQPWPGDLAFDSVREAATGFVALDIAPP